MRNEKWEMGNEKERGQNKTIQIQIQSKSK